MNVSKDEIEGLAGRFDQTDDVDLLSRALTLADSAELDPLASKAETLEFRVEKLRILLTIFNHIDAKLIPGFDFNDAPSISTAPPPETGLPSGVTPKSIADPQMRAQYEKAIAANQAKTRIYTFQSRLQKVDRACVDALERHVSTHFPKSSESALDKLVDDAVRSQARRASLKEQVAAVFLNLR